MRLLAVLFIFILLRTTAAAIKCVAGNNGKYDRKSLSVCTSLSFCVTMKHKSGTQSYSCDGNSFSHPSLCNLYKRSPTNEYFYPSQIGSSSTSSRQSRFAVSDSGQSCYNAGELGDVCCCSTDFCNNSKSMIFFVPLVVLLILLA